MTTAAAYSRPSCTIPRSGSPRQEAHQHIRLLDDPPIGHKLCVGCLLIVYTGKVGAVRQHIEIAFTQLRRPLGSLFFKRGYANKAHGLVILLCDIDDFPGVQSHAGVTGNLKFCHSTLTQFHNTLSQFQFHSAALGIFFIKAPRKPHGMLAYNRTTVLFFHIPTSFYVVY